MICFLQARMNSRRLPGKSMKLVYNKPLVQYAIDRLNKSKRIKKIIVITSKKTFDDKIFKYCKQNKIIVFRGNLENVYQRYIKAIKYFKNNAFVRITGDSPNIDPNLVDKLIFKFNKNQFDIVTNCKNRTFPKGQSVEVINSKTFLKTYRSIKNRKDYEHVTTFFYDNEKKFKIFSFENKKKFRRKNLSVDNLYDLKRFKNFLARKKNYSLRWKKIYENY
tara:strand:+ start:740 stop:1399 length:660 start_codon:yes stop_codon:yes gene_type:complete